MIYYTDGNVSSDGGKSSTNFPATPASLRGRESLSAFRNYLTLDANLPVPTKHAGASFRLWRQLAELLTLFALLPVMSLLQRSLTSALSGDREGEAAKVAKARQSLGLEEPPPPLTGTPSLLLCLISD